MPPAEAPTMVRHDGTYDSIPLRREAITASVVQTRVQGVDGANPEPGLRRNLDYFLECIDIAQGYGPRSDLLLFHEFPITGFSDWTELRTIAKGQHDARCDGGVERLHAR